SPKFHVRGTGCVRSPQPVSAVTCALTEQRKAQIMQDKLHLANTSFAINLFAATHAKSGGKAVQVSPFSVRLALSMAAIGSQGATRQAFLDTFHLPSGVHLNDVNAHNNRFLAELLAAEEDAEAPTEISVANGLWLKKDDGAGYRFHEAFKADNARYYNLATR